MSKKFFVLSLIVLLSMVALYVPHALSVGNTYYVRTDGNDANTGLVNSAGGAWQHMAKCISITIAGSTCRVQDGTYVEGTFRFNNPGTAGNYITMMAEHQRLAILSSTSGCNGNIEINTSYIHIDGIRTQMDASNVPCAGGHNSSDGTGVRSFAGTVGASSQNHDVWVSNTQHDASSQRSHSIKCAGDRCLAEYNIAYNGIESGGGHDLIARYNRILGSDGFGSGLVWGKFGDRNDQSYGNYIFCDSNSGTCLIVGGSSGDGNHFDDVDDHECYNCVSYRNVVEATTATPVYVGFQGAQDSAFINNTFKGNGIRFWVGVGGGSTPAAPKNNTWYGNTLTSTGPCTSNFGVAIGTHVLDYNNFFGCSAPPSQTHNVSGDPLLSASLTLLSGSPLVNAALAVSTWPAYGSGTTALNGGGLYNGPAPDVGAFETVKHASCVVENGDASTLRITYDNNLNPPLLPASPAFGAGSYTTRKAGVNNVVTGATRVGTNQIYLTLTNAVANGDAIDYSYSTSSGNVTDSALIGNQTNQPLLAITNQACTNNVGTGGTQVFTQTVFHFHGLRGTQAAPVATPYASAPENTNILINVGGSVRLRVGVSCTIADCPPTGFIPRYSRNGGSYTIVPDAFASDNIAFCGTATDPDIPVSGTPTTQQLSGSGTFASGALVRTSNAIPTIDMALNGRSEIEYCFAIDSDTVSGDVFQFRLYKQDGTALDGYTVTPKMTVVDVSAGRGF